MSIAKALNSYIDSLPVGSIFSVDQAVQGIQTLTKLPVIPTMVEQYLWDSTDKKYGYKKRRLPEIKRCNQSGFYQK